jgi:multidrug efflux pump subunit AcrB
VPLKQVADVEVAFEPSRIYRRDRLRTVTVESDVQTGTTAASVIAQLRPWLEEESQDWEIGYRWELGGETETSTKANESIVVNLPLVGLIILMLLVWQFNSLVKPLIILLTIPLSLIGVSFGLLVAGQYMGFMPFLGIISLAGIVINNAIVLIDRIDIERNENGLEPPQAVVEAAQRRLRPILLTTATTVGGLIPLWLGGGALWEAMAVAIIFGLLFATGLTLGVVPILYSLFYRVRYDPPTG